MTGRKLNKSQRRAFAKVAYLAFHWTIIVANTVKIDDWFLEALTDEEIQEMERLKTLTHKLADRWRAFAWKLDGYDSKGSPPRKAQR